MVNRRGNDWVCLHEPSKAIAPVTMMYLDTTMSMLYAAGNHFYIFLVLSNQTFFVMIRVGFGNI
jgi:hypothetical protein